MVFLLGFWVLLVFFGGVLGCFLVGFGGRFVGGLRCAFRVVVLLGFGA